MVLKSVTKQFASVLALSLVGSCVAMAAPVTAVLRLQEKVPMESLAQVVKQKTSPMMRPYSVAEIAQIAGPSTEDYQALVANLQAEGFTIVSESPTHLWLSVRGDSTTFERVFATQLQTNERQERHAMVQATVPNHLALVASVGGLNSDRHMHPMFKKPTKPKKPKPGKNKDTIPGVSLATITKYYGLDPIYKQGINGSGMHIAIATYSGFYTEDVQYFYNALKLSPMPTVDVVAFNGTAAYDENSAMETQLDAEFSGMIAPGAAVHVFASATNDDAGELAMFTAILDDNRAQVVNYSWGGCETQVEASHATDMQKQFARAVAQGVNIMVASGDSGSDSCQDNSTVADWPAANDHVVAVGGTTLLNNGASENGWNGSGGGISSLWSLPAWQTQLGSPYTKRSYPDVAFNADPDSGQGVYITSGGTKQWMQIGGTSMAAPQWSGILTLVGAARKAAGKPTLGYLNPIIYGLSASDAKTAFNDITDGNNGAYSAGVGFDAVTGLGTPKASALLGILVNK